MISRAQEITASTNTVRHPANPERKRRPNKVGIFALKTREGEPFAPHSQSRILVPTLPPLQTPLLQHFHPVSYRGLMLRPPRALRHSSVFATLPRNQSCSNSHFWGSVLNIANGLPFALGLLLI